MKSSKPCPCNFSGMNGVKATLLEVMIMGVVGVLGARTTAGAGMYTNNGGAMVVERCLNCRKSLGKRFGEDEVEKFELKES